jgi:hypothetical protein
MLSPPIAQRAGRQAGRRTVRSTVRRALIAAGVTALLLAILLGLPLPALAHGEVTGVQDVIQDYGVLLFLSATVLIGAGVLAWVTFSPQPDEDDDEEEGAEIGTPLEREEPGAAEVPAIPEGSRGSR